MKDKNNKHHNLVRLFFLSMFFPLFFIRFLFILLKKIRDKFSTKLRFSIAFKLNAVYTMIFMQIFFIFSLITFFGFSYEVLNNTENSMLNDYKIIDNSIQNSIDIPKDSIDFISNLDDVTINIFDSTQKIIYSTEKNKSNLVFYEKGKKNKIYNINNGFMISTNGSNHYMILSNKTTFSSNDVYIQIVHNLSHEILLAIVIITTLFILNIIFIFIVTRAGSRASKKILKPVEVMTNTVKNITINKLDTRLDVSGSKDELKDLAITFNEMLNRIQNSYEIQNQFVSDASHELRTPISVILGYANMLNRWGKEDKEILQEAIDAIKSESESMKTLVENLLFLARGDKNTQKIQFELFYIDELIEELLKEAKLIDNNHKFISTLNERFQINADRKLIKEALRVFMDNSIKYTPLNGSITLNCLYEKDNAIITLEDTGIGISKEDLPKIFDRFYRADKSRTKETGGTGLGLSIAKWIVLKHKGNIEVQSTINVGTKIIISVPINR